MNNNIIISLESATMAMKAQRILAKSGYRATVEKSVESNGSGCRSNLRVNGNKDILCKQLMSYGIKCR